jgi:hypothetical protein
MALGASLVLALLAILPTATAAAWDDYHWDSGFGGYVDRYCATSVWTIVVYDDINYGAAKTKICSSEPNLCDVHLAGSERYQPPSCWSGTAANDRISSFKVTEVPLCRSVSLYFEANYGTPVQNRGIGNTANVGSAWNDKISSIRLTTRC